jgi:hypothetical protein
LISEFDDQTQPLIASTVILLTDFTLNLMTSINVIKLSIKSVTSRRSNGGILKIHSLWQTIKLVVKSIMDFTLSEAIKWK